MNPTTKAALLALFSSLERSIASATKQVNDDWLCTDIQDMPMIATELQRAANEIIVKYTRIECSLSIACGNS